MDCMKALTKWWRRSRKWRHCPHRNVIGVYGDGVYLMPKNRRLICEDCGNSLDGPVVLANARNAETIQVMFTEDPNG